MPSTLIGKKSVDGKAAACTCPDVGNATYFRFCFQGPEVEGSAEVRETSSAPSLRAFLHGMAGEERPLHPDGTLQSHPRPLCRNVSTHRRSFVGILARSVPGSFVLLTYALTVSV